MSGNRCQAVREAQKVSGNSLSGKEAESLQEVCGFLEGYL